MKAPSSDASNEDGANDDFKLDYCDFFSVLMYYGHMSKEDIMNSSRPFLYGIYKKYTDRACENLGVSSKSKEDEVKITQLSDADYPKEFHKISDMDRKNTMSALADDQEFMRQFSGVFKQF